MKALTLAHSPHGRQGSCHRNDEPPNASIQVERNNVRSVSCRVIAAAGNTFGKTLTFFLALSCREFYQLVLAGT